MEPNVTIDEVIRQARQQVSVLQEQAGEDEFSIWVRRVRDERGEGAIVIVGSDSSLDAFGNVLDNILNGEIEVTGGSQDGPHGAGQRGEPDRASADVDAGGHVSSTQSQGEAPPRVEDSPAFSSRPGEGRAAPTGYGDGPQRTLAVVTHKWSAARALAEFTVRVLDGNVMADTFKAIVPGSTGRPIMVTCKVEEIQ